MAENVDRIDFRIAASDIISYQNGNYISLILFFLSFFIIYLTVKSFMTDFDFFFSSFYENSLSLSLSKTQSRRYLCKKKALSVLFFFFFFFFFFMNGNTERAKCALSRVCIP